MKLLRLIAFLFIFLGIFPSANFVSANANDPNNYKVLSENNKKLSITNVKAFLIEGRSLIDYGIELVKKELTTIEEVERVCLLDEQLPEGL